MRQLNTHKAKLLVLIEDLVAALDWPIEYNLAELGLSDVVESL